MLGRHNRLQTGPGVLDGLSVTKTAAKEITVAAGTAVDSQGREVVVLIPQPVNVTGGAGATVFLTIGYDETQLQADYRTKGAYSGYTRWTERPQFKVQTAPPAGASAGIDILLASMQLDASGNITSVDPSGRQLAQTHLSSALTLAGPVAAPGEATHGTRA